MLTDAEKVDVRRFCGFAIFGNAASATFGGYRFFQQEGALEFRMQNMAAEEEMVLRTYLDQLRTLEAAIPAAGAMLNTDQAAVFKRNRNEVDDRLALFDEWCRRLCRFLGISSADLLSGCSLRLIV